MNKQKVSFTPLNVVLKGKAQDIRNALDMIGMPHHTLVGKIDGRKKIATAKVLYDIFDPHYIAPEQIPFASMPGIKFLMLGDGGTESKSDGTYAIFKDFGDSVMIERFTPCSIHQEEIVDSLLEDICKSFLTVAWSYTYLDFSCGEESEFEWKNPWKSLWNDDSNFKSDGNYLEKTAVETFLCPICFNERPKHLAIELPYIGENQNVPAVLPVCHTCQEELGHYKRMSGLENLRITMAKKIEKNPKYQHGAEPDYVIFGISNIVTGSVAEYNDGEIDRIDDIPACYLRE